MSQIEETWRGEMRHCTRELDELEATAWQVWIVSGLAYGLRVGVPHPRVLAHALQISTRPGTPLGTGGAALVGGVIVYAVGPDNVVGLRIIHETSHVIAARYLPGHSHGDVVALTLMLLFPGVLLNERARARTLTLARLRAWQPYAPRWVAPMRLELWAEQQPPAEDLALP